jgi:hypothetical protein
VIDSGRARLSLLVMFMLCSEAARAGVWGADPSVGVSGDYASNPVLADVPHSSGTDAALLFDSPVTYQGDALKLSFLPSFRLSDRRSYASLNSDYVHLTASGEFDTDRNTLRVSAGASRDSSLYENFVVNGTAAVRRDGLTGDLGWTRHLTERLGADLDVNTVHVRYGAPAGTASLVDYKYSSVAPDLSWQGSERDRVTLSAGAGQYDSRDGTTRSRSIQGQLGYDRALSEIWSLKLTAGYSRQQNRLDLEVPELVFIPGLGFAIIEVPVRVESQVKSPVYSARLTRSGPRLTLNLSATRQETPTGFAFLSRQRVYELQASFALSERWSASLHEYWLSAHDPSLQGPYFDRIVNSVTADCTYQVSEHYSLEIALSRVDLTYSTLDIHVASNQITLTLNYKFNHISLQ